MEKFSWTAKVSNCEVLNRIKENRCIISTINQRKRRWLGHVLRHDVLLRDVLEGRMTGKRTRGRKRLIADEQHMRGIRNSKETSWRQMSVMCLSDGSHWPATTAEYQKKRSDYWFFFYRAFFVGTRLECFIDSDLSMETHVKRTVSCCFSTLGHLRNIRRQIPTAVFQSLVKTGHCASCRPNGLL